MFKRESKMEKDLVMNKEKSDLMLQWVKGMQFSLKQEQNVDPAVWVYCLPWGKKETHSLKSCSHPLFRPL